jgi:5'(3')-deoxyribonucleotidase
MTPPWLRLTRSRPGAENTVTDMAESTYPGLADDLARSRAAHSGQLAITMEECERFIGRLRDHSYMIDRRTTLACIRFLMARVRRLYLDCDGVLADFDTAFEQRFGHQPRAYEAYHGTRVFWRDIQAEAPDFYRTLPLMPRAQELVAAVAPLRPIILTGCPMGGWAEPQKLAWAAEHFPGVPMITCVAAEKRQYCRPGDILVDDQTKYRDRWTGAGGVFIHYQGDVEATLAAIEQA